VAGRQGLDGIGLPVLLGFRQSCVVSESGRVLPRSIRNIPDALAYLRQVLNAKKDAPLNNLASLFDAIAAEKK
jgi:hypothetical protein